VTDTAKGKTDEKVEDAKLEPIKAEVVEDHYLTKAGRDALLLFDDTTLEDVEVPEWGGRIITLRGLTGSERDSWESSMVIQQGQGRKATQRMDYTDLRARLLVRCIVDRDTKERVFEDRHAQALGRKSASALQRLFEVAQRLSRLTDEDVDELVGNSNGPPSDGSGSN
jgi:hypothetical protein